jgi:ribosomal protein S19
MSRSLWKGPFVDASLQKRKLNSSVSLFKKGENQAIGAPYRSLAYGPGGRSVFDRHSLSVAGPMDPLLSKKQPELNNKMTGSSVDNIGSLPAVYDPSSKRKDTFFIWSRRSCILPQFVGSFVQIYNGRSFVGLKITEEMVGHKFGEFASTRKTSSLRRNSTTKGQSKKKR